VPGLTRTDRRRLAARRLAALGLVSAPTGSSPRAPADIVRHLGAAQAQDLGSGLWSLGVRGVGAVADILAAVERRELTRTWPMRGTLHWVAAEDVGWMCATLAGPSMRAAERVLVHEGLTPAVVEQAGRILLAELDARPELTRADVATTLSRNGIDASGQRCYHLLVRHCQTGLLCQGPIRTTATGGLEPTFVRLEHWVERRRRLEGVDALAVLAERYVTSHGPVTEADLARWCDQPLRPLRAALEALGDRIGTESIGGAPHLVAADAEPPPLRVPGALLLPGFDEYLLGYRDRNAQLTREQERLVVPGGNGVFRPTLVVDGLVAGTWRRTTTTQGLAVEISPWARPTAAVRRAAEAAGAAYGRFLGRRETVRWTDPVDGTLAR